MVRMSENTGGKPIRRWLSEVAGGLRRVAAPVLGLTACGVILVLIRRLGQDIDYDAMIDALRGTSASLVLWSIAATALSFLALIGRDIGALRYAGAAVPVPALLVGSFCGSALGNAVGFGALAGGAVRYRTYGSFGVTPEQVARMMLFITVGFGVGLAAYTAINMILGAPAVSGMIGRSPATVRLLGGAILVAVLGLLVRCPSHPASARDGASRLASLPDAPLAMVQLVLTGVDLIGAAAALWVLLPVGRVDFATFSAVFSVATALGVISHVPGGIGVFEAVVVFALGHQVSPSHIAAALLAYRGIYFLLPLLLAAAVLAAFEMWRLATRTSSRVFQIAASLAPTFLGVVTFAVGAMLLVSGATPAFPSRLSILQDTLPLWAVESSNFLASLTGVVLLFVARGLFHRLDGAWWLALAIAVANLGLSLAKGLALVEDLVIACLILLLLATRQEFTRPASLLRQPFTAGWFAAVAIVLSVALGALFLAFREIPYGRELWWQFEFDAQAPRALRAVLGAGVLAMVVALLQLLRPAAGKILPSSAEDMAQAERIIRQQGRSDAMMAMMGDKCFLFSASGKALLSYARQGRSWVALYDPVGPREEWPELIWRFVEMADAEGGRVAFYEVRPDSLPLYLDAGLKVIKLGEEGCIRLADFSLQGSSRTGLRYALKRGEREGFDLQILAPGEAAAHSAILKDISDAWLAHHKVQEKGFSVAAFEPRFLAGQWVALLREAGRPVAFVTVMATDLRLDATVGLMRYVPGASGYAMEYIFVRLILHLKQLGFEVFSLGMAPLAGMARHPLASLWHRFAGLFWEHGGLVYRFQGLRAFKAKFHPEWEPRYLAASGSVGPFLALADVVALTGGGGGK